MTENSEEDVKPHDDYAVYDESSCRGNAKRTGLGFLSKSIKKPGQSIKSSQILTKSKLIGKDNIKKHPDNPETFHSKPPTTYHDEDSKTGMLGKKKEILIKKPEHKKKMKKVKKN